MHRLLTARLLAIAACAICIAVSAAASAHAQVVPLADCHTTAGGVTTSWFGYANPDPQPITLPAGTAQNFFLPSPPNRGQPSTFKPGTFHRVFSVTYPDNSQVIWTLANQQRAVDGAVATPSPICSPNTILSGSGPPADTVGNGGDFYLDTAANVLYGPKVGDAWPTTGVTLVGPQGPPGQNGTNGTNGTDGNTILSGVGAPSDALGNDGDYYIDIAAHLLYGPRAGGHWPATGVPLVGPTGATGPTGPQRPQHPPGMPVCRNTRAPILACDALFAPGTWTVSPTLHPTAALSRCHTVYARGHGTFTRSGRLTVRLHKLRRVPHGGYTLTIRLKAHGLNMTIRRTVKVR